MIAAFALAAAATTYSPVSKWTLDYQQDLCLLTRPFTADAAKATLGFRQAPADAQTEVIVLFADDPDDRVRRGFVALKLADAGQAMVIGSAVSARVPGGRQRLLRFMVPREQVAALGTAPGVTIEEIGQPQHIFKLEKPAGALRALNGCENDQMVSWGIDPSQMATPAKPIGDYAQWFRFPVDAMLRKQTGETTVRWKIDATGRVSDCTVIGSSGTPSIDRAACATIAKHAAYEPAIDKVGKPMPWVETRRILWSLGPSH